MAGKVYGYARVSSKDQNFDRQLDALHEFGVKTDMVFADKASGKNFERPEYRRMVGSDIDIMSAPSFRLHGIRLAAELRAYSPPIPIASSRSARS